ncbi:phospholipase A1 [Trypanosoma conorhini]|uniref:1-alkyl-2-acetylglycerophosphocholine esterase n=1 Tax=Trypanosoma conorhini TaxID=83891 RepID=A0A3R7N3D2_9TRYP|nr:phospholipase A1 [Trypanosoma conorhini]RNF15393.1 phospholipase A1 [Trypanosoma conorhini]
MGAMEGFLACAPTSYWDYIISPHVVSLVALLPLSALLHICGGAALWALFLLPLGCLLTAIMFILLPLPIIKPVGGRYHVGVAHIRSRQSQAMPPLAVFYPTNEAPRRKGISYLPFNDARFMSGIASNSKIPLYFLRDFIFVRLQSTENARPIPLITSTQLPLPVIVFSHGLYGYHRLYSCLLADLAARGAVVVSVGHCDGSASFMSDGDAGGPEFPLKQLDWESPACEEALAQRVLEVRRTVRRLSEEEFWKGLGFAAADVDTYLRQPPRVHLSGHSFGGATALVAALQEEQESAPRASAVQSVIVFDPWHFPLQRDMFFRPIECGRKSYTTPTLMIQSEEWVHYTPSWDFFQQLAKLLLSQPSIVSLSEREQRSRFVTEKTGSTNHYSVSDVVLLSPIIHGCTKAVVPPQVQILEWSNTLLRFAKQHTVFAKGPSGSLQ